MIVGHFHFAANAIGCNMAAAKRYFGHPIKLIQYSLLLHSIA